MKFKILIIFSLLLLYSCEVRINADQVQEGNKLLNEADIFGAEMEFDDELSINENNVDALVGKIKCLSYYSTGKQEALSLSNRLIKLMPDSSVGYLERGIIYASNKEYKMASEDFQHALKLGTPYPTILYFNIGENMRILQKYDEAIRNFKQVVLIDSFDAKAYSKLGQTYWASGDKDSACYFLCIAKGIGDKDAAVLYSQCCK